MERLKTVMAILDKMYFFQGQRAGRELWNDKSFEVQEEDLENFKRDINTIGSYIWKIVKELKQYRDTEEQGLLLRLPCKLGSTLHDIIDFVEGNNFPEIYVIDASKIEVSKDKKGILYTIDCTDFRENSRVMMPVILVEEAIEIVKKEG